MALLDANTRYKNDMTQNNYHPVEVQDTNKALPNKLEAETNSARQRQGGQTEEDLPTAVPINVKEAELVNIELASAVRPPPAPPRQREQQQQRQQNETP